MIQSVYNTILPFGKDWIMSDSSAFGFSVTLDHPITDARPRVEAALKEQGFGILTEIDIKATLKQKLDIDFSHYEILGACNPGLAHRALSIQPDLGLLLPCNVTLHQIDGKTKVSLVDPIQMLAAAGDNAELADVAREAEAALRRVQSSLQS